MLPFLTLGATTMSSPTFSVLGYTSPFNLSATSNYPRYIYAQTVLQSDLSQLVLYYLPWEEGGEWNMIGEWLLACQVVTQMKKMESGSWVRRG